MPRVMFGAALLGTAAAMAVVMIPTFHPGLKAGSQAAPAGKAPPERHEKPQTIEQGLAGLVHDTVGKGFPQHLTEWRLVL